MMMFTKINILTVVVLGLFLMAGSAMAQTAPVVSDIPDQTIAEGATFTTINLDDYVTDVEQTADQMTWTYSGETELTVSIDVNRVATITIPSIDWNGAETITFRATDPDLLFGEDAATFTVTAVNDAPVVSDIPDQTVAEGATFTTINLDDFVSDVDNTDAEMTWTYSGNTELTVDITANVATITIPSTDWNGAETITFRATDPGTLFGEDAATFTVTAVNDAPVVSDIPDQTVAEGATFTTINLDDFVSDVDNTDAEMTWAYSGNTELTVDITANVATITIPSAEWNGAETITFRATDPGTLFAEDAATFTVTAVNDAPVVSDIPDQTVAEGATFTTINLDDYVSDVDNTDAEMTWTYSGNTELTVDITANVATITIPSAEWNGAETITFRATDPGTLFAEDAATFTVTAVNDAPVVSDIPDQTVAEGATFTTINLDDFVSDVDNTDAEMTWTYSGNTELTVDITANVATITIPSTDWNGAETITFRATDPGTLFGEDAATFTVTAVNDAPVVSDIPDQTVAEGATFTTINLDDFVSDVDNTDAEMTWAYSGNTELTVDITANVATITIPSAEWNGAETITFRATDPGTLFAEDAATFTVTAVNDAPVVSDIPDQTVAEGATFTTINLDDYVSDVDNTDAEMTWTYSGNTELTVDITANVATITIPSAEWNGAETITFRATDPGTLFAEDAATFTVTAVNDAPVVSDIPDQTVAEGATFTTINLDDFVSDVDNTDAEMTWTYSGNTELTVDITANVATITIPSTDWNGAETITFRATDPGTLFGEDAATFTVTAVNDAPVVSDIPDQTVAEGATFTTINLDDYVSDVDNTDAEMTWTYSGNTELTVDITANVATITIPSVDWNGAETITFRATDPGTLFAEDAATFTVTGVNDAPVVSDIPDQTVAEGATFATINLDDFVTDTDNTDAEMTWTYTGNAELTVDITANVATITIPSTDWNGAETITFRATDPGTLFAEDAATFTVTAVNDAPVVSDIPDQTIAEGATFTTINLDDFVSDVDNTDAEMTWTYSGNTELTVDITANVATITIPSAEWSGAETITFRATDPGTLFAEDAATFTVTAVNDAPVVSDIPDQTITEGSSFVTFDLDDYVTDIDNAITELTWSYTGSNELMIVIDASNIVTIGIPSVNWNGSETITFRATDPGTAFGENAATFTVNGVNDQPIVTNIPDQTVFEGNSFTSFDLDDFVSDVDNTDAELTWTYTGNTELTVNIDANNIVTITPPSVDWNGSETITFRATDPGLLFSEDAATFTVTAVGDTPVVSDIPDQTIAEGATFATINLDDYVTDVDNTDAEMTWTYSGNSELSVSIDGSRVATITIPSADWNGAETITFRATDPGLLFAENAATFTVTAVNDTPVMTDIPDQTIAEGASFATINLDNYVSDVDNTDAEMTWTYSGNTNLSVSIDGSHVATITAIDGDWNGAETITFRATDPGSEFAEDGATFTITAVNDAPVVSDIPDQTVAEGGSFTTFDLDDYVTDVDNTDAEMIWTYTGNTELTVSIDVDNIVTIGIPTVNWNGAETITFRATDPGTLFAEDAATFTVTSVGDAPVVSDIPDQTIAEGATFTTINLDDYVSDIDNTDAEMTWTYTGNTELTVAIDGSRVATITIPSADWNGAETITFRATDPGLLFAEDAATFTVTAVNDAPVLTDIPDQTIDEGATFTTINLDDYVSDVDNTDAEMTWTYSGNTELTVDITTNVATITIPSTDWNGAETITFRATDPGTLFAEDAAIFTVNAVNDAPVLTNIPDQTVAEGETFTTFDLDDYVTDVDNTDAEMTWTYTGNTELTVSIDVDNIVTIGIPTVFWNGAETITFRATDPGTLFAEDAATFTVTSVGDAPVVSDIPDQTIAEGATFTTINLDDYVSDVDNTDAEMTWTYSGNTELTVSIDGSRVATITIPNADWNGAETITFRATDPGLLFAEDAATFTVTAVNDAPVVSDIPDQLIDEGATFTMFDLDDYVTDIDNTDAEMTWTYTGNTELTVSIDVDNIVTIGIPSADWNGAETITFRATDPGTLFAEDAATFTVNAVNDAPVVSDIPDQTVAEGDSFTTINLDDFVTDVDNTDAEMTWTYTGNTELTVDITANVATITIPDANWNGAETITFRATDPGTLFAEDAATFTVTGVGDAPVVSDIPDQTIDEGATFTTINLDDFVSDVDNTDAEMTWTYSGNTELTVAIDGSRIATITIPNADWNGAETITFRATDPGLLFAEDAATFTVNAVNDAPVLDPIGAQVVAEGGTLNLPISASDIDGTIPTLTTSTPLPTNATFTDNGDGTGTFVFSPDFTQEGAHEVRFYADDGVEIDSEIVTIMVTTTNQAPILDPIGAQTVAEGVNLNFTVTASDPDGTTPTLSAENMPANASFIDNGDGTGTFDFTPDFTQANAYDVTFSADDGITHTSEVVTITVTESGNQAPILDPIGAQAVMENANLNFTITASDPDGTTPTLSAEFMPTNATFDAGTGVFDFNPDYDQAGDYDVVFKAFDGELVDSEVVTITVINMNRAPVLNAIATPQSVDEGATLAFTVTASDPDGTVPTLSTGTLPANATFDGATGAFSFTPDFSQQGAHTIWFYADDGTDMDSQLVTINVGDAGNQAPILDPIGPLFVSEGVTLNRLITASDPDGTIPTLSAINLPVNATFTNNGDGTGTLNFTPDFTQAGTYGVTFIVSDGTLADSELVLLSVTELGNQAPVLAEITSPQVVNEGDTLTIELSATDPDDDAIVFSYTYTGINTGFSLVDNFDGTATLRYIPTYQASGTHTLRVFATDDGAPQLSDVQAVEVIVVEMNQPPTIDPLGPFGTRVGRTLTFTVTARDSSAPVGSRVYLTASGLPTGATFVDNGNNTGTFSFTPVTGQDGDYVVRFIAVDDGTPQMSTSRNVDITVVATNNAPVFATILPQTVLEGNTLTFGVSATDADGTIPTLTAENVPTGATFIDNGDGTGTFTFVTDFTMSGLYGIDFRAFDGIDVTKKTVLIQVYEAGNQTPILDPIDPVTVTEAISLTLGAAATDPDGTIPTLTADSLPNGATFTDNGDGTGTFDWVPYYNQQGVYNVYIIASDGELVDTAIVVITVEDAGNQTPVINPLADVTGTELRTIRFTVTTNDPDSVIPILSAAPLPGTSTFTDNGNYTGSFEWVTTHDDEGVYDIIITATDGENAGITATFTIQVTVLDSNQVPYLLEIPPNQTKTVDEGSTLTYRLSGFDNDGLAPIMTMVEVIPNFVLVDNGDGTAVLTITPDYTQGRTTPYAINFRAYDSDPRYTDDYGTFGPINFTVRDVPAPPVFTTIPDQVVNEGAILAFAVVATHPGGLTPSITAENVPLNGGLIPGSGGTRAFRFTPDYTQAGVYEVRFIATVNLLSDTELVTITVNEAGNQAPEFTSPSDTTTMVLGETLDLHILAEDPDLDAMVLTMLNPPANTVFVDSANGAASLAFTPDATQNNATHIMRFIATDPSSLADTLFRWVRVTSFLRGDANSDGSVNIGDVTMIIDYVFRDGNPPEVMEAADVNNDGEDGPRVNIGDALYLVNYIFRAGPPPVE
ncbi:MAG: tandem-95 repeat protein [Candidatus Zixiibacteriota bacterium]